MVGAVAILLLILHSFARCSSSVVNSGCCQLCVYLYTQSSYDICSKKKLFFFFIYLNIVPRFRYQFSFSHPSVRYWSISIVVCDLFIESFSLPFFRLLLLLYVYIIFLTIFSFQYLFERKEVVSHIHSNHFTKYSMYVN